ncbi:cupredoxin family copper-binding protein [Ramlibacter ginsenosidimutans]|uniref:Cupredoxin family copper-binding protein n=1 Tax=Ramlibacter ginsenosidimutans TaxID=502333 RepID=A0A934TQF0_9BURK|nr:cupredoxin family copper-binding protein [Ramlibacter ginsenosidimutans]MBK6005594.1 cupredoxin family copper-binding protein [Ramlibacter ginsenosidimutans]
MRAALCAFALVVACGSAAAATHVVTIEGMKFEPGELTVHRGDRITWTNKDLVPHTVTAAGAFNSGAIAPGKSWSWLAGAPGAHDYVCTYHPTMKARVVVQ